MRKPSASDAFHILRPVRKIDMLVDEAMITLRTATRPRLFNLDLHIAVIRDIAQGLNDFDVDLTRWSISGHNAMTRRLYRFPDPVDVVNARTWQELDVQMIDQFRDRYGRYLKAFDGFVTTHSPALAELFADTGKPTLVTASTRYEAPYSDRPADWARLNEFLRSGTKDGSISLVANNLADANYLTYFTGITPQVVPSVCDYQTSSPHRGNDQNVVLGRSGPACTAILEAGNENWRTAKQAYGRPYAWCDLAASREVFVIPYNVSTMTLFELATAGTPVAVPGLQLLKELARTDSSVVNELSFYQVNGISAASLAPDDPNNFESPLFLDWWLKRSDFYNVELMPNVRVVEDLAELGHPNIDRRSDAQYWHKVNTRNSVLKSRRAVLLADFLSSL